MSSADTSTKRRGKQPCAMSREKLWRTGACVRVCVYETVSVVPGEVEVVGFGRIGVSSLLGRRSRRALEFGDEESDLGSGSKDVWRYVRSIAGR